MNENGRRTCEVCTSQEEHAVSVSMLDEAATAEPNKAIFFLNLAMQYLLHPERSLNQTVYYRSFLPGITFAVISSILLSIIVLIYLNQILTTVSSMLGGLMGVFSNKSAMRGLDLLYFQIFIKLVFGLIAQWSLLSIIVLGVSKLFRNQIAPVQVFNIIGVSKLYLAAGCLIMLVVGFLHPILGISVFFGSMVMAYAAVSKGLKPILSSFPFYVMPTSAAVYLLCEIILVKAFIN